MASTLSPAEKLTKVINAASSNNKVVDISKLTNEGVGARRTDAPKPGSKSKLRQVGGTILYSNNTNSVTIAHNLLPDYVSKDVAQSFFSGSLSGNQTRSVNLVQVLREAYEKANKEGKVIDVSKLSDDGKGLKIVDKPKTDRGTKKMIGELAIISNNYENFKKTIDLLSSAYNQDLSQYADNFANTYGTTKMQKVKGVKAPVVKTPNKGALAIAAWVPPSQVKPTSPRPVSPSRITVPVSTSVTQSRIPSPRTVVRTASPPRFPTIRALN